MKKHEGIFKSIQRDDTRDWEAFSYEGGVKLYKKKQVFKKQDTSPKRSHKLLGGIALILLGVNFYFYYPFLYLSLSLMIIGVSLVALSYLKRDRTPKTIELLAKIHIDELPRMVFDFISQPNNKLRWDYGMTGLDSLGMKNEFAVRYVTRGISGLRPSAQAHATPPRPLTTKSIQLKRYAFQW